MVYVAVGFAAIGLLLTGAAIQRRLPRLRSIAFGLFITYFTFLLIFAVGEIYFRYIYVESANLSADSSLNWFARYYQRNSLGFRDREWTPADLKGKTTILFTGDSLTAGWGLNNPADRYTDVLAKHLGDGYAVINLGVYGTATPEQLKILKQYPLKNPNVVIMQYFLNDIEYAGLKLGLQPPPPPPEPTWMDSSYLIDFLWGHLFSEMLDPHYNEDYWTWNYAAYDNATIWNVHKQEIEDYINYVDSIHARLIVVIFPNLLDPVRSIAYVDRVAQVFQASGHNDILKLFDQAAAWSPQDRMVSPRDAHPSAAFDHLVGDLLYQNYFTPAS